MTKTKTKQRETESTERERVTLTLTGMAFLGAATAEVDGQTVYADFGIPGEDVVVEIEKGYRDYSAAKVVEVLRPAESRVAPPCQYFGTCGGCQWQHIAYEHQLELKRDLVQGQLERAGFEEFPVSPTVPSPNPYGYRNHARFTARRDGELGYITRVGNGRRFLKIDECLLMHPAINDTLANLQGRAHVKHQISIRHGVNTGQTLIRPEVPGIAESTSVAPDALEEELNGRRFRVSASSFFQTNTPQAERLMDLVRERLHLTGSELLVDAYAGVGTFAVLLAPSVRCVIAIEESASAIKDGIESAEGIENIEFRKGKVEQILPEMDEAPEIVILDPSRAGCHTDVLDSILNTRPRRVVYVSCEPFTLARDLRVLCDGGYQLVDVTPLDMFPQTYHVESVATLELT